MVALRAVPDRPAPGPPFRKRIELPEDISIELRLRLYEWDPKDLARHCGVSLSCVYAFRSGRTKVGRLQTLLKFSEACGMVLILADREVNE